MMKNPKFTLMKRALLWMVLALLLLSLGGGAMASRQEANADIIAIEVLYKLDPRLSGPHMGERWVSPALYDVVSRGSRYTIEAKVETIASNGARTPVAAEWSSTNPDLVRITPREDSIVALDIRGQGLATLEITTEGIYKALYLNAAYQSAECENLRVMLSQTAEPKMRAQICRVVLPMVVNP